MCLTMFQSTAIYPNRIRDKEILEMARGLSEEGNDQEQFRLPDGRLFAQGYVRIVYGDHGPYIEFTKNQIKLDLISHFGNNIDFNNLPKNPTFYYYWLHPESSKVKIYLQLKPVIDKKNAPHRADGKPSCFNRKEGYADYRKGYYYVNPYDLQ